MSASKVKARKMWGGTLTLRRDRFLAQRLYDTSTKKFYVLPADAASVERMVEQMAEGMIAAANQQTVMTYPQLARAALAAIGVKTKNT